MSDLHSIVPSHSSAIHRSSIFLSIVRYIILYIVSFFNHKRSKIVVTVNDLSTWQNPLPHDSIITETLKKPDSFLESDFFSALWTSAGYAGKRSPGNFSARVTNFFYLWRYRNIYGICKEKPSLFYFNFYLCFFICSICRHCGNCHCTTFSCLIGFHHARR